MRGEYRKLTKDKILYYILKLTSLLCRHVMVHFFLKIRMYSFQVTLNQVEAVCSFFDLRDSLSRSLLIIMNTDSNISEQSPTMLYQEDEGASWMVSTRRIMGKIPSNLLIGKYERDWSQKGRWVDEKNMRVYISLRNSQNWVTSR